MNCTEQRDAVNIAEAIAAALAKLSAWLGGEQARKAKQQKEQMERLDREIQDALRGDK